MKFIAFDDGDFLHVIIGISFMKILTGKQPHFCLQPSPLRGAS